MRLALLIGTVLLACQGSDGGSPTSLLPAGLASCGATTTLFSALPVESSLITGWVPLGSMNPPAHTFPTDHQYIYLTSSVTTGNGTPLLAPGAVTIVGARRTRYFGSTVSQDYSVSFSPCAEVLGEFGHVASLSAELTSQLGAFDQQCSTYSPSPGLQVEACYTGITSVPVAAGTVIGTTRGLDLSLFDTRITPHLFANPARWSHVASGFDRYHVVPFSDYYAEPSRTSVRTLLGSFDGRVRRIVEPLGGSIASDVIGTAQGVWLLPQQPTFPEIPHLAIVPDAVDPSRTVVSIGTSLPGMVAGAYQVGSSASASDVNRSPSAIVPGMGVQCLELGYGSFDTRGAVLLQLVDAGTLKVEARPGAQVRCSSLAPFTFTSSATLFVR